MFDAAVINTKKWDKIVTVFTAVSGSAERGIRL